jgi:hypothetical protein
MFVIGPARSKEKFLQTGRKSLFRAINDSECSACPSDMLTYIIHPCTPSPIASPCQLTSPASSPLAIELIHTAAALLVASESAAATAAARSPCLGYPASSTPYVAVAAAPVAALSHGRADISHCYQPHNKVRPPLTKTISRVLPAPHRGRLRAFF